MVACMPDSMWPRKPLDPGAWTLGTWTPGGLGGLRAGQGPGARFEEDNFLETKTFVNV